MQREAAFSTPGIYIRRLSPAGGNATVQVWAV
jgi:hypothetical protein